MAESAPPSASGEPAATSKPAPDASVLVVYFSHEGHTRAVAEKIAGRTSADVFEIVPVEPYPEGVAGAAGIAEREHDEDARPSIVGMVENLDRYGTVFLGYPIWYGTAPMVVGTFLEGHDFSGMSVQPFCTSSYTPIKEASLDFVRSLASDAEVGDGVTANSDEALNEWLGSLGY